MNFLEKLLWRWQGKSKINATEIGLRYTAIRKLGETANPDDVDTLLTQISDTNQTIRNAAALAIKEIFNSVEDVELIRDYQWKLQEMIETSTALPEKLVLVEIMGSLSLGFREQILGSMIKESQNDLQYAVIQSLEDTQDLDILDDVLSTSNTEDLVLRRIALQTWYFGIAQQSLDHVLGYITPRLHYLVRAAYELQTDGEFLRKALSYANQNDLPHPKAYPDFMIRYITELLGNWDYDPEAYRSLHAIMVPSYFTFERGDQSEEQAYVQL